MKQTEESLMIEVALIGCGAIGSVLAKAIDQGKAGSTRLRWLYDIRPEAARKLRAQLKQKPRLARSLEEICADAKVELAIEAASQEAVRAYALKLLQSGKDLVILSVGALADPELRKKLEQAAQRAKRKIYIPSGAVVGIDGVRAASIEDVKRVVLTTRKPPRALARNPRVGRSILKLKKPRVLFEGPARKAVQLFPASVNVAATLSLAGVGFNQTTVRVVADPTIKRNIHEIHLVGRAGEILTVTRNLPIKEAPGTSRLAALSTIRLLRNLSEPLYIGA